MSAEVKTFSELILRETIFWANDEHHGSDRVVKIEVDPDDKRKILIELSDSDAMSFPEDESTFKDGETTYTTDKALYSKLIVPFIEKKIAYKEKIRAEIDLEIAELKDSIADNRS